MFGSGLVVVCRSSASTGITSPVVNATAAWTTFDSSRRLPGQW